MLDGWQQVALGEVARPEIDGVGVEPDAEYSMAGILGAGQGLFWRETILGRETAYRKLHRLRAGHLVMRKLTAGEGPITVVPDAYDGAFVSTEFPTFALDESRLLPAYMRLVCQLPSFHAEMRMRAIGTVERRKRLSPAGLLAITVMLPPLDAQRRITDVLRTIDEAISASEKAQVASSRLMAAQTLSLCPTKASRETGMVPISDLADYVNGRAFKPHDFSSDGGLPVIRIKQLLDADADADYFDGPYEEKHLLANGDIIFSWSATLAVERWNRGSALLNQHLFKVVPANGVDSAWLTFVLRSALTHLTEMTHGTTMKHITRSELGRVFTAKPSPDDQRRLVAPLDQLAKEATQRREAHQCLLDLRRAMLSLLLTGRHAIPDSYDQFTHRDHQVDMSDDRVTV